MTNNTTELCNGWLKEFKGSPVLTLIAYIRRKVMRRLRKSMKEAMTWTGRLPPNVQKKPDANRKEGRSCKVLKADDYYFEVIDDVMHESFVVHLDKRTCGRGAYEISGISCKHAMPCIAMRHKRAANYVDLCLTVHVYIITYSKSIKPSPDQAI